MTAIGQPRLRRSKTMTRLWNPTPFEAGRPSEPMPRMNVNLPAVKTRRIAHHLTTRAITLSPQSPTAAPRRGILSQPGVLAAYAALLPLAA